jgi:hypothetical protein
LAVHGVVINNGLHFPLVVSVQPLCTSSYVSTYCLPVFFCCSFIALATLSLFTYASSPAIILLSCHFTRCFHKVVSVFMPYTVLLSSVMVTVFILSLQFTSPIVVVCFYVLLHKLDRFRFIFSELISFLLFSLGVDFFLSLVYAIVLFSASHCTSW